MVLQAVCSLRISEVLSIRLCDVSSTGQVYVTIKKSGSKYVVTDTLIGRVMLKYKWLQIEPFIDYNRYYIYRIYRKLGIVELSSGEKNVAVTHAFRHKKAKEIRSETNDNNLVTQALHHNNSKSQIYYGKR